MNLLLWFKDRKELVAEVSHMGIANSIKDGQIAKLIREQRRLELEILAKQALIDIANLELSTRYKRIHELSKLAGLVE